MLNEAEPLSPAHIAAKPAGKFLQQNSKLTGEGTLSAPQPASTADFPLSFSAQAAAPYEIEKANDLISPLQSTRRAVRSVRWLTSLEMAREQSNATGKPAVVYWYGENCPPCRTFERNVLADSEVQEFLHDAFVCVKINAERLNQVATGKTRLNAWKIDGVPQVSFVPAHWRTSKRLQRTNDPRSFIEHLDQIQLSSAQERVTTRGVRHSTQVPVRRATLQTIIDETNQDESGMIRLEVADTKQPGTTPVYYVQYSPVGGYSSYGGDSPYGFVMPNNGYGSTGGRFTYGYGPRVGSTVYGGYHAQPAHYQAPLHYQPMQYGGNYNRGQTMVCGPWGCAFR